MPVKVISEIIELDLKDHQVFVDKVERFCMGKSAATAIYNPVVYIGKDDPRGCDKGYASAIIRYEPNS